MIWLNGDFRSEGKISINDRGFLLGDGIFETILVDRGHAFFLDAHLDRLRIGLATIKIDWRIDEKAIAGIIGELFSANKISGLGAVRLTISRGPGPRGLRMRGAVSPTSLLTISEFNPPKASPADLIITEAIRPCDSIASRHKLTHYTDNILAIGEAEAAGADEAVMMNRFGRVACAAASNVFVIFGDGDVVTPPVEEGALPGIVRDKLIGMPSQFVVERPVSRDDILTGAVFLTNSLNGLREAILRGGREWTSASRKIFDDLATDYESQKQKDREAKII